MPRIQVSLLATAAGMLLFGACSSRPDPTAEPRPSTSTVAVAEPANMKTFYDLAAESLDGKPVGLDVFRGRVTLVVNVASQCGYTPQYAGLQKLHEEMRDRGFAVLGFPSNDFGGQEPGTPEEIRTFCTTRFAVDFPMFSKVQTRAGAGQSPVYAWLGEQGGQLPSWNFGKYLIGKDGAVLGYFPSNVTPDDAALRAKIEAAL